MLPVPLPAPLSLLDPPLCYGPRGEPMIDVDVLRLTLRRRASLPGRRVVLSDIPDDWTSLEAALALPEVLGALAVGCGGVDLWLAPAVEAALPDLRLRRALETPLARVSLVSASEAGDLWVRLADLAAVGT